MLLSEEWGGEGDCFGDYGMFRSDWNHLEHVYGYAVQDQVIGNAWKTGRFILRSATSCRDRYQRG